MDEITEEDLNSIKGGPAMVEDKYPGINRRYAIWMDWVGIPFDHEKIADHSSTHMVLARRSEESNDYAGIYAIWLDYRLDGWVRTLKYFERCDKDSCDVCRRCALETPYGGVSGHKLFDDWLEAWCKKNKCPVRFVNYKKEMEEFEREYEEEEKARQGGTTPLSVQRPGKRKGKVCYASETGDRVRLHASGNGSGGAA